MVAFPDSPGTFVENQLERQVMRKTGVMRRALKMFVATALVLTAIGIWMFPSTTGDEAARLIKMAFSVTVLLLGLMFMVALNDHEAEPEVQLDLKNRRLIIAEADENAADRQVSSYSFDELSEISLVDGALTARDAWGKQIIAIPVSDRGTLQAIEEALSVHI